MNDRAAYRDTLRDLLDRRGGELSEHDPAETVRDRPAQPPAPITPGLADFGEVLGQGGMGIVRAATQRALHRRVAVKSLRDPDPPPHALRLLLHEATVAGLLDHPNILPVHDIVVDAQGRPHIVMKRVEGSAWSALARSPRKVREAFGAADPLVWNLEVLLAVSNAVAYAHDRGILHRDLKLDNVMIGAFGEVLVLDWGVAAAFDDRYGDKLPIARDQRCLVGTPTCMAPELAMGQGDRQGPATDVYLLGGMLYQVLTGHPPHRGDTVERVLASIAEERPALPEGVPGALARIADRALSFDPGDRYPSAIAFRDEIRSFLDHRGSARLAREAARCAAEMSARIAAGDADRAALHRAFDRARFGFEHALTEWPGNTVAADGLREARVALARWELDHDEPGTAAALLEAVDPPPQALLAAIDAALGRARDARRELDRLRADHDPAIGQRTRLFVLALVATFWLLAPILYGVFRPDVAWWHLFTSSALLAAFVLGLGIWARDSLSRTALNRASWATMLVVPIVHATLDTTVQLAGLDPEHAIALRPAVWAVIATMLAVTHLPILLIPAALYAGTAIVGARIPELTPWLATLGNVVLLVILSWIWWSPDLFRDPERPDSDAAPPT